MNILFLSEHSCIRVLKQLAVLSNEGHRVTNLCKRVANQDLAWSIPYLSFWNAREDLVHRLRELAAENDIIHVHNEPSWLVTLARQVCPDATIVFDCHDLDGMRHGIATAEEALAFSCCNAAVFPSPQYRDGAVALYRLDIPTAVVYSWPTADMYAACDHRLPGLGGIVYEGGCLGDTDRLHYLDYRETVRQLTAAGIPFSMYGSSGTAGSVAQEYIDAGAVYLPPYPYLALLRQLTRFDFGLVAGGKPSRQYEKTIPNKLFEYLCAGIPVITWGATPTAEIVQMYKVGAVLSGPGDLTPERYSALVMARHVWAENARHLRDTLVMEKQANTILTLYSHAKDGVRDIPVPRDRHPDLSIVTGTCNRLELLVPAIQSFRESAQGVSYEIVIVDGGSTDGTLQWLRTQDDVRLIEQGKLVGAVKAFNAGFKAARGRYVANLNDDLVVCESTLKDAVDYLDANAHVAQVALRYIEPHNTVPHTSQTPPVGKKRQSLPYANFGVTRRAFGDSVGWWGEYLHHYGGDCELSVQVWAAGLEVHELPGSMIKHQKHNDAIRVRENRDSPKFNVKWASFEGVVAPKTLLGDRAVEWGFVRRELYARRGNLGRVLDFGCGETGPMSRQAAAFGGDVFAIDLEPQTITEPGVQFAQKDIFDCEAAKQFNVIINCSTIEHVGLGGRYGAVDFERGDIAAMDKCLSLLADDGVMLFTCPVGVDAVFPPLHRVYGEECLRRLLEGWRAVGPIEYWYKTDDNIYRSCSREAALAEVCSEGYYAIACAVLEKDQDNAPA